MTMANLPGLERAESCGAQLREAAPVDLLMDHQRPALHRMAMLLHLGPLLLHRGDVERQAAGLVNKEPEYDRARYPEEGEVAHDVGQSAERPDQRCDRHLRDHRKHRAS